MEDFLCSNFVSQVWGVVWGGGGGVKFFFVVLASEPVGGRSRATELPCWQYDACSLSNFAPFDISITNHTNTFYLFN